MASGKKNYFRHSMNARNDHKLRSFMDMFGRNWRDGYFYFFTLLEMCGSDAQEGKTEHTFHKKTLRDLWGTSAQGVHDVCMKCTQSALVVCTLDTDHVTFSLPNLLNYTGKYEPNAPNKEKKINKTNKDIRAQPASPVLDADFSEAPKKNLPKVETQEIQKNANIINTGLFTGDLVDTTLEVKASEKAMNVLTMLNAVCFKNFRPTKANMTFVNARLKEGYALEDFSKVFKFKQGQWGHDAKMCGYLRPQTLLSTKFDSYLQESENSFKPKIDPLDAFFEQYAPQAQEGA